MIYYNNNIINKLYRHGGLVNKIDKVVGGSPSTNPSTSKTIFQYVECATPMQCEPPSTAITYTVDEQFDFTKPVYEISFENMAYMSEHQDPYDSANAILYDENNVAYYVFCNYTSSNDSWSLTVETQNGTNIYTSATYSFSCCTVLGKPMYLHSDEIPTIQTCNQWGCYEYECYEYECLDYDEESGECMEYGDCIQQGDCVSGQEYCEEEVDNYVLNVLA